jgi:DNA polymerase elongation subunit (family B)
MKLLTLDIETRPIEAYAWGIWNQNIGINQIKHPGALLCFAAKFRDERATHFASAWEDGDKGMTRKLYRLLDQADAVTGWNSDKFDLRWINSQFLKHKMGKPSPYAKVDLMKSVKRQVMLPSYKLDFVAQWLGVGEKVKTGGFELWTDVLAGKVAARNKMKKYNIGDVKLTEAVFDRLHAKGWVLGLPNASIGDGDVCPNCGSDNLMCQGQRETKTRTYQRYQCRNCLTWIRSVNSLPRKATLVVA